MRREQDEETFCRNHLAKSCSHLSKRGPGRILSLRPPAFQFYADDFLAGTVGMTNEERGLYITLLCIQWNKGGITDEDFERHGKGIATASLSHVKSKFQLCEKDAQFRNKRLEIERKKQSDYRKKRANAGVAGAKARWQTHIDRNAIGMTKDGSPSPSPSPSNDKEDAARPVRSTFMKPTDAELNLAAAKMMLPSSEVNRFVAYYESNGWRVGKNPMKSWLHALTGWKLRWEETRSTPSNGANLVVLGKELERVIERMKSIKATYGDHQSWPQQDIDEFSKLRIRRTELRKILGVQV